MFTFLSSVAMTVEGFTLVKEVKPEQKQCHAAGNGEQKLLSLQVDLKKKYLYKNTNTKYKK